MDILKYVTENNLILIPTLAVIGLILKKLEFIKDKYIPLILASISIIICMLMNGVEINSFIQGILIAGVTVGFHQGLKQLKK